MAQSGSIPGTAVAAATAGALLIYAALRDVSPTQALRDVMSGKPPGVTNAGAAVELGGGSTAGSTAGDSGSPEIVRYARQYLGIPYVWGGATPARGFDCSGLVTYVLAHDMGLKSLPSSTHTVAAQFLVWRGATTVKVPAPGDLVCWPSHVAIASGDGKMIEAPGRGKKVRETKLRSAGATFRRVVDSRQFPGAFGLLTRGDS
jgi:cell wall-associated NlpC family hydrolase